MSERRTRQDFLSFLNWMADKGLMAKATATARKAAANRVLSILSDEETQDVTKLDLDDVMRRFTNLEGREFTPGSLNTYFSRLRSALDDFKQYLDRPLTFRPGIQPRATRKPESRKESGRAVPTMSGDSTSASFPQTNVLSIPIRPDKTIIIQGLPYDLSDAEATKIANVIRAMAAPASGVAIESE